MNKQKTDCDLKLKLVREISEAMAYEYSEYDAMNNNDTPEDIAVNLLDKFLSTQRQQLISEIEGIPAIYIGSHPIGIEEGPYLSKDKVLEVLKLKK